MVVFYAVPISATPLIRSHAPTRPVINAKTRPNLAVWAQFNDLQPRALVGWFGAV